MNRSLLFLDTEFASFKAARLLSLGLITDHQQGPEFYVELSDGWQLSDCSDFVRDVVLPRFNGEPRQRRTRDDAGKALRHWLAGFARPVVVVHDSEMDWRLLLGLTGPLPDVQPKLFLNSNLLVEERYHAAHPGMQHNALHDARALRAGWRGTPPGLRWP